MLWASLSVSSTKSRIILLSATSEQCYCIEIILFSAHGSDDLFDGNHLIPSIGCKLIAKEYLVIVVDHAMTCHQRDQKYFLSKFLLLFYIVPDYF